MSAPSPAPAPPPPSGPTSEQLEEKFLHGLRPLLKADSFTGAGAVSRLTSYINAFGISDVDISIRLETLSKIRDNAPNHYFRAWAENSTAMSITKKWLTESGNAESDSSKSRATMPLLHVSNCRCLHRQDAGLYAFMQIIDRLPMTVDILKESGIGKEIKRLSKSSPSSGELAEQPNDMNHYHLRPPWLRRKHTTVVLVRLSTTAAEGKDNISDYATSVSPLM